VWLDTPRARRVQESVALASVPRIGHDADPVPARPTASSAGIVVAASALAFVFDVPGLGETVPCELILLYRVP